MRKAIAILATTLALTAMGALRPACADKWALMVGVNDYVSDRIPDLRGCENDIKLMKAVLVDKFGFPEKNIRTLFSRDATRERILSEIKNWLIAQSKPGDVVVFDYSGHGSQAPDDSGLEEDHICETICPTDIRTDQAFRDIRDHELGDLFDQLKGRNVTVILDSCHSGDCTRDLDDSLSPWKVTRDANGQRLTTRNRYIYRPELFKDKQEAPAGRALNFFGREADQPGGVGSRSGATKKKPLSWTLLSGCRSDQTSADAPFQLDGGKYYYFGVLTYNLVGALMQVDPKDPSTTYEKIWDTVTGNVKRRGFKQEPQLEGLKDARPFFAATTAQPPVVVNPPKPPSKPFVLVSEVGGDRIALNAGSTSGVTARSVYTLYEATDNDLEGPGIGLAEVSFVSSMGSIAVLKRADATKLKAGCRAVETLHYYPPNALYVTVNDTDVNRRAAMNAALAQIPFVKVADKPGSYTDRFVRVEPQGNMLNAWLVDVEGQRFAAQSAASVQELVQALRKDLTNAYVIKKLTLLDNPSPSLQVKVWVDKEPKRTIGEPIVFHFKANQDCYLNLVDCGTSGEVTVLFPNAWHKDNKIVANREYSIPSDDMGFTIETQGPSGREMVKAIATQKPLNLFGFDFAALTQDKQQFLSRDIASAPGAQEQMQQTMSRGLGHELEATSARDFRVRPVAAVTTAQAPAAPVVQQATMVAPPKPPVVVAAPPKPPAQQQPVQIDPEAVPTSGWATDSVIVDVRAQGSGPVKASAPSVRRWVARR